MSQIRKQKIYGVVTYKKLTIHKVLNKILRMIYRYLNVALINKVTQVLIIHEPYK